MKKLWRRYSNCLGDYWKPVLDKVRPEKERGEEGRRREKPQEKRRINCGRKARRERAPKRG